MTRTPGVTAAIVLSLALGTGANAAVYSAVDALLFRAPAGVMDPPSIVEIYTSQFSGATYGSSSYPDFLSIASPRLAAAAAVDERDDTDLRLDGALVNARLAAVSDNFWDVLRMAPYLGAWPRDGGTTPTRTEAVLSFEAWQALGGDSGIVGRVVRIGERNYLVGAVAPPRFRGLHLNRVFDAWIPLDAAVINGERGNRRLAIVGRLAPGARVETVQGDLNAIAARLARTYPKTNQGTVRIPDEPRRMTVLPYSKLEPAAKAQSAMLGAVLLGATCLLLISACVNAGSLLLSRGIARRSDLAIQTALGADRARLVRQFLFESVGLALAGAAGGVIAATWTAGAIPALFAPEHAHLLDTRVDKAVMLVTLVAGGVTGVLFGVIPALVSTRALSADALRGDPARVGERQGAGRLRMGLVAAQLALSTIFLAGSMLLEKVIDTALRVEHSRATGFLAVAWIETYDPMYRHVAGERLRHLPSAAVVGWVAAPPLARSPRRTFSISHGAVTEPVEFDVNFASREYFSAMYIPLVDGRFFDVHDDVNGVNAVVVNEALAQRYFGDRAVGHVLTDGSGATIEIVGVVRTRSYRAFERSPQPMIYYPMTHATARGFYAVVRSRNGFDEFDKDLGETLRSVGRVTNLQVSSFDAHLARALAADRLVGTLIGACGLLALALAALGVHSVTADMVRRRTKEIGLRIALGAGAWQILRTCVGSSMVPAVAGLIGGVVAMALIVRLAQSFVFGLPSLDAALVTTTIAGLLPVVIAALVPPARRALRVSPLVALRDS